MDTQEVFNRFLEDHYEVCENKGCDIGDIVDGIINEVREVV